MFILTCTGGWWSEGIGLVLQYATEWAKQSLLWVRFHYHCVFSNRQYAIIIIIGGVVLFCCTVGSSMWRERMSRMPLRHWWSLMSYSGEGWENSQVEDYWLTLFTLFLSPPPSPLYFSLSIPPPLLSISHTHYIHRSADIPTRQRYVRLVESVKENGGTVRIFSSLHVSGERKWLLNFSHSFLCNVH